MTRSEELLIQRAKHAQMIRQPDFLSFLTGSSFWQANYLIDSAWTEHIPFAFWITDILRPKTFVELGTHYGLSYFSFCQAIQRLKLPAKSYAIDSWTGDEHAGFYGEDVFETVKKHNCNYSTFSTLIQSTFDEAVSYFENASIDLLHIDGYHTYDAVKHDFETWLPKLSPQAIVLFHDTNIKERNFGVYRYWAELSPQFRSFEFFHGCGLGILAIGNNYPDALEFLLNNNNTSGGVEIKEYFARLGLLFSSQLDNIKVKKRVTEIERQLEQSNELIRRNEEQMLNKEDELREKIEKIRLYNDQVSLLQLEVNKLKEIPFNEILAKNNILETELKNVRERNSLLQSDLENTQAKANVFENEKSTLSKRVNDLANDVENKNNIIVKLNEEINQLISGVIHSLQNETIQLNSKINETDVERENLVLKINGYKNEIEKLNKQLNDSRSLIDEQNQKTLLVYQQLDAINGRLSEIYSSDGWKLLSMYYRFKGKYFPEGSPRYKKLKKLINILRNKKDDNHTISDFTKTIELPHSAEVINYDIIELPVFEQPKVSIIIPAYNGWNMNYKCLHSIRQNTYGASYEVIFADDASTDETKNINAWIKNITVVRNEENLGFLKNCNHAASFAKGDYIHFLNNDTEVTPGWLSSLTELMDKNSQIGMAGSKLIYPDGRLQEAGGIIWQDASGWNYGHNQDPENPEFNYVKEVDYISGASIMVRKTVWQKLEGFDERYSPAYCEDADLAFEIRKMNMKVVYQPLSVVIHHEGFSHGSENDKNVGLTNIKSYQKVNNIKFARKWEDVLRQQFPNNINAFWTRDRSHHKKTILVIDHYVPHFDKDAGSRTVFHYLKLLVSLNYNVKFIGDNFYRHEPYTKVLQQMGIEVLYGPWYEDNWQQWIKDNYDKFDLVLLNRPHIALKYIDFIRTTTKAQILYYGHDLHFIREKRQYEIEKKSSLLESSKKWKETECYIFNKADLILAPSEDEKNIINTLVGENKARTILPYFFESENDPVNNFSQRKNILFVGGFSHKPNVDAVLWFCNEIWPSVKEEIPETKFIVVGSNMPEQIFQLASEDIIIKGYLTDEQLNQIYSSVKIIVAPLRYGAGVKGKTVDALYRGIPLVTTSFGVEGFPGDTSFLIPQNTASNFSMEVIKLYYSGEDELVNLSKREKKYIKDYFSEDRARKDMIQILNVLEGVKA